MLSFLETEKCCLLKAKMMGLLKCSNYSFLKANLLGLLDAATINLVCASFAYLIIIGDWECSPSTYSKGLLVLCNISTCKMSS